MNYSVCSADGSPSAAIGVCIDCGCAACERRGAVAQHPSSAGTHNMVELRSVEVRRFTCARYRALDASQHA